jgi:sphinganine-1-phosphate aldolase
MPVEEIMKVIKKGGEDARHCWKTNVISGCVYTNDEEHWKFINECMAPYVQTNALHMDEYKIVTQMEAEILRMGCNMYNGDANTCGVLTSGGTESILLAMLCYRQHGLSKGITKPNIVMSNAAHAAFDKACFLFQIEMRKIPVTSDFKLDFKAMKGMIDSNTVALVASCPEYPYGTYDPVPKIAALAQSLGIGCHSDCCLGSFVNPYVEEVGYKLPHVFDFRVPGVTSISADPHKYGMGPKGVSMLLFKNKEWRDLQFFCTARWNGGLYCTTTLAGSRPGNIIVGTWAVMMKIGREGYVKNAKFILDACVKLKKGI